MYDNYYLPNLAGNVCFMVTDDLPTVLSVIFTSLSVISNTQE